jgi:hypothetical protein
MTTREIFLKSLPDTTDLHHRLQLSFLASGIHVEEISKQSRLVGYVTHHNGRLLLFPIPTLNFYLQNPGFFAAYHMTVIRM